MRQIKAKRNGGIGKMKRLMAIDYGDRRIGIAVSDMLLITAQPVGFITVNGKKEA